MLGCKAGVVGDFLNLVQRATQGKCSPKFASSIQHPAYIAPSESLRVRPSPCASGGGEPYVLVLDRLAEGWMLRSNCVW